jgi:ABC-type multidrug transport system fused ATPase/permease subunit
MAVFFTVMLSVCVFVRSSIIIMYSWYASRKLHENMIEKVLNAPINLYFDVTPIGKILNRFSKDFASVEGDLSYMITGVLISSYFILSIVIVSAIAVPYILLLYPFIFYALVKLFNHAINAYRETTRIAMVTKSPILSKL